MILLCKFSRGLSLLHGLLRLSVGRCERQFVFLVGFDLLVLILLAISSSSRISLSLCFNLCIVSLNSFSSLRSGSNLSRSTIIEWILHAAEILLNLDLPTSL